MRSSHFKPVLVFLTVFGGGYSLIAGRHLLAQSIQSSTTLEQSQGGIAKGEAGVSKPLSENPQTLPGRSVSAEATAADFFERFVRPTIIGECIECHSSSEASGGLSLESVELNNDGQSKLGRDHNHYGFSVWMAGGGIKGGVVHGATDELGFKAVDQPTSVHDFHATILHLLGLDHERLTYRYAGRDFRLTDVHGDVIQSIIA